MIIQVADAELEKDAKALAEKDGWILKQNFIKYALNTELCKDDPQERVNCRYNTTITSHAQFLRIKTQNFMIFADVMLIFIFICLEGTIREESIWIFWSGQ